MKSSLGTNDARIDIVDFTRQPMPSGDLEFSRSGLASPPVNGSAPSLWRGTLRYSAQRTLAVWASVRIREERPILIAARQIRYGATISPEDVALVRRDIFPFTPHLETPSDTVGHIARRAIPAGSLITDELLEVPPDIVAGDTVHVVVTNGSARITFDAVARSGDEKENASCSSIQKVCAASALLWTARHTHTLARAPEHSHEKIHHYHSDLDCSPGSEDEEA